TALLRTRAGGSRRARPPGSGPRASASRRTSAPPRLSSTPSSTRCPRRTASTTSTCRARRPASGRPCRAIPRRRNELSPLEVTGEAAGEIRRLVPDIETLARRLADVDYLVDEGLATSMFLSLRLPPPP